MAATANDRDLDLESGPRSVNLPTADIFLNSSAPGFHVASDSSITPPQIVFTGTLFDLEGDITFSCTGATISAGTTANSTIITAANMTTSRAVVTASVTSNGITFNRTIEISKSTDGAQGPPGIQGVPGNPGADGVTYYTWIKYATSAAGANLSDDPTGRTYIGFSYGHTVAVESTNAADYTWSLIQGPQGNQGVQGPIGPNGQPTYTWIKYSDAADGTNLYDAPTATTQYIGISPNQTVQAESTVKTDYVWSKFRGDPGPQGNPGVPGNPGADGITYYTWIKYATSSAGANLADDPTGKTYIGFSYGHTTATESNNPADYTWSLIQGPQGNQGVQGPIGPNGLPTYTWIKYADVADGTGLYDAPTASTLYIGISPNQTSQTESTVKTDYVWSKFRGDQGPQGPQGNQGVQGPIGPNGLPTYTWIKYADVADGTGLYDAPTANTLYIGISPNQTVQAESTVKTDYTWSKFRGDQGVQGTKGTDGVTTYTWIKYAMDSVGTGITDSPTGMAYIGFAYNKSTATESTVQSDYTWSLMAPNDLSLIGANVAISANSITKNGGTANTWDASGRSKNSFVGGAYVSGVVVNAGDLWMIGLNTDPALDNSFSSIDYGIFYNAGSVYAYSNGSGLNNNTAIGTAGVNDILGVGFDGSSVVFMINSTAAWTVTGVTISQPLAFDSSLYNTGSSVNHLTFRPMTSNAAGTAANNSLNNKPSVTITTTVHTSVAYANGTTNFGSFTAVIANGTGPFKISWSLNDDASEQAHTTLDTYSGATVNLNWASGPVNDCTYGVNPMVTVTDNSNFSCSANITRYFHSGTPP